MNLRAQLRINAISAQTMELVKRSEQITPPLDSTERAQIAVTLRQLIVERQNIEQAKNPLYITITEKVTLFRIVSKAISFPSKVFRSF